MNLLARFPRFATLVLFSATGTISALSQSNLAALPDAPSTSMLAPEMVGGGQAPTALKQPVAGKYAQVILPGQTAPKLSFGTKVASSMVGSVSPTAIVGWVVSAGYSQATNGSPNYGQTGKGFGQRLGAAAARASSENVFGGVIAGATHQDIRYYKMGKGHSFVKRVGYAITRPLITRTDGGHQTLNLWGLGGDLAGSALTPAYYPPLNQSFTEVLKTFGGSVGGDAIGYAVSELFGGLFSIGGKHSAN